MSDKILLVDDDPLLVRSTTRLLDTKFDIEAHLSGQEALDWLESGNEPDVIVSDLNMPEMNGIAFLKQAYEIAPYSSFYLLSGNQDAKMRRVAESHLDGIVDQYINKPCNPTDLVNLLTNGAEKSRAKRTAAPQA